MQSLVKALGKGYIQVTEANYKKFLYGHRDFDLVVLLTSLAPQLNCVLCREFTPTFETVALLYSRTYPDGQANGKDLYFLYADFADCRKLFETLGLELIPKLCHYPPTTDKVLEDTFDKQSEQFRFYQGDFLDLTMQWIQQISGYKIVVYTAPDYGRMLLNAVITFSMVLLFKRFRTQVFNVFTSLLFWGAGTIIMVLLFLAGLMFTQIRSVPYVNEKSDGVEAFAPSAQMQYGVETQIIAALYGLLGVVFLVLAGRISVIKSPKVQLFTSVVSCALLYLLYSIVLSIFNIKYKGYPYLLHGFGAK